MTILVAGGCGFIGSHFILDWIGKEVISEPLINLDKLTYAANPANLSSLRGSNSYVFAQGGIEDTEYVGRLLREHEVRAVINFAAESHVDRSIVEPETFVQTNVVGTSKLLEAVRDYWSNLDGEKGTAFRFLHISTDEVFGTLQPNDPASSEEAAYRPNSPYAASKAAADHLVRAYYQTYGLPAITTSCSNNYGPRQFPEKLIPLVIHNALAGHNLPIYGDGKQVRDWLYVGDHCSAIRRVLEAGKPGETYNVGANGERENIEVVRSICSLLDRERPRKDGRTYAVQIVFTKDRPGHDRRYAINAGKIRRDLGWVPAETFETGIAKTVRWYLDNEDWVAAVTSGAYRDWIARHYA